MLYTYDASGTKLKSEAPNNLNTFYAGGFEYRADNALLRIGLQEGQLANEAGVYSVQYYQKDHLGNVRAVMEENGSIIQETEYYAFGLPIQHTGSDKNKYLYNGKEKQPQTEWLDYGARMYDPTIGRWNCVDAASEKSLSISPYAYVVNNPINHIDILGLDSMKVNKDGTYSPLKDLPSVTVTQYSNLQANYPGSWLLFSKYNNEQYNPYIYTARENRKYSIATVTTLATISVAPAARIVVPWVLRNTFSFDRAAATRKLVVSLSSQVVTGWLKGDGLINSMKSIDFADTFADLTMTPLAGAVFSSQVDLSIDTRGIGKISPAAGSDIFYGTFSNYWENELQNLMGRYSVGGQLLLNKSVFNTVSQLNKNDLNNYYPEEVK